jgi:hypothetical protein
MERLPVMPWDMSLNLRQLALDELPGNNLKTFFFHRQAGKTGQEYYYDEQLRD